MKIDDNNKSSEGRVFINRELLPKLASTLKDGDRVLFVGTDSTWDYKSLFFNPSLLCEFITMDIAERFNPDIVGDISNCPQIEDNIFNLVILVGVYEYVVNKEGMFKEINRILKPDGKALLSIPGRGYYPEEKNSIEPWEAWDKVKPLLIKEVYVVGERNGLRPSSVHLIVNKQN